MPTAAGGGVVTGGTDFGHVNGPPALEVLPLKSVTQSFFNTKESDLTKTTWTIGVPTAGGPDPTAPDLHWAAWQLDIGPPPSPLPANTVLILFKNSTTVWDKEISAFDSRVCPHMVTPLRMRPGQSILFAVNSSMATTVLLRRQACGSWFIGCGNTEFWEDIGIFSEPNFYTLFGARMLTIDWFFSQGG